jgi:hypothetical protein
MTIKNKQMKKAFKPEELADLFLEYVNSANLKGLVSLYGDDAILITAQGGSAAYCKNAILLKNLSLGSLACNPCQLSDLDLSHNTALGVLNCGANLFTSLDLTKNTGLVDLSDLSPYNIRLFINDMPSLNKVCVWVMPFPPEGLSIDASGSPNVYFSTDCSRW